MKTTLDLPDDLVRQLKRRAAHEDRNLKDVVAELLRRGLDVSCVSRTLSPPVVLKDEKTGLPVIQCRRTPSRKEQLTPNRVAQILTEQETSES